jgi:hypothetical protein
VRDISSVSKLTVHLAPLGNAHLEASAHVDKTIATKATFAQISTDYNQQQKFRSEVPPFRTTRMSKSGQRNLVSKNRSRGVRNVPVPYTFHECGGQEFRFREVFFARQSRPQVAISDLDFRFCCPHDRTRECTRPVRETLSRPQRLKGRR